MKKRVQGVLTVEASIVLTLMLLFILFLFSFGRVYRAQNLVSHATLQTADAVAIESYLRETALQSDVSDIVYLASNITDSSAISAESLESLRSADLPKIARQKFIAAIASSEATADEKLKRMGVKEGLAGIDFSACTMDLENDDVIVAITYTIEMQFPILGADEITVTKAAKSKTFGEILFEVSTEPNNPGWGSTGGDDRVIHGATVQIVAIPNYGYRFVSWNDGVTDNPRTVTVTDAQHYIAIFEKDKFGVNLNIGITYNTSYAGITHTGYGTVNGAGNYSYLDNVVISATPSANYQFVGWDDNGDGVIDNTNATRTITVDKTYDIKAIFKPALYTVTVKSNNDSYGSAQVSQGSNKGASVQVEYGSNVQLIATSKDSAKYIFSKWNNNSTQASTTVTVKEDASYEATFILNTYTVTFYNGNTKVHATNVIRGSSIDGSKSAVGSTMPPSNPTKSGVTFDKWKYNNSTFTATTKVNGDISVYAAWKYTVTLNANGGTVSWTSKTKAVGESVTLPTPTLNNHTFKGWQAPNGTVYGGGTTQSFGENITLTAKWSCNHKVGTVVETYTPYCSDIYSNGQLKSGVTMPYRKYQCNICGDTWKEEDESLRKHRRMNYKDGSEGDDFWENCNKKHPDTHYGYCGKWSGGSNGKYHTWDGYYHILCSYCYKEEQGYVWCYVDGKLVYYNLHKCAMHGSAGKRNCPF